MSRFLQAHGFDAVHTLELPEANKTTDRELIRIAVKENRIVVTKDSDFLDSFMVSGLPEKLIIVRTGNINNKELVQLFEKYLELLITMISRSNLVEITRSKIAEHGQS